MNIYFLPSKLYGFSKSRFLAPNQLKVKWSYHKFCVFIWWWFVKNWAWFSRKVVQKLKLSINHFHKKCAHKQLFFNEKKIRKIRTIFDLEKWLWKSNFDTNSQNSFENSLTGFDINCEFINIFKSFGFYLTSGTLSEQTTRRREETTKYNLRYSRVPNKRTTLLFRTFCYFK